MKSLLMAVRSKEGRVALVIIAVSIIGICVGGYLLRDNPSVCDIVVIVFSVLSIVGAEQFCRLIIQFRKENGEE